MLRTILVLSAFLLLSALPVTGSAQHPFGDYVIHHGTMLTSKLDPEVARQYDIQRSDHRGLVTVAVRKNIKGGDKAVRAEVRATGINLSAQRRELAMREVDEGDAIYYLADFRIDPPETVRLEIHVTPEGADEEHTFEVTRHFHSE